MAFSWIACFVAVLCVVVSGAVSWIEETFTRNSLMRPKMGFIGHAGMWGDFFLMPVFAGLVFPWLWNSCETFPYSPMPSLLLGVGATALSVYAHKFWWVGGKKDGATTHIFPRYNGNTMSEDVSMAGRFHVVYMAIVIVLVVFFFLGRQPMPTIIVATAILALHATVGTLLPGPASNGKWINRGTIPVLVGIWTAIPTAVLAKIYLFGAVLR